MDEKSKASVRRGYRRIQLDVAVTLNSDHQFFETTENLSVGGLFVATRQHFELGSIMRVRFSLPDVLGEIKVDCVVRWYREASIDLPSGVGLEFVGLKKDHYKFIDHFIAQRPPLIPE